MSVERYRLVVGISSAPARDQSRRGDAQPERILTGKRQKAMFAISHQRGPVVIGKRLIFSAVRDSTY
jgi:hypothetical protein